MIEFRFNIRKATEAASRFVELSGGSIGVVRLMKLLYLAERQSLASRGHPIIGDRYVSMKHGPVVSRVYDLCKKEPKGKAEHRAVWLKHLRSDGRDIELVVPAPVAALSRADLDTIDAEFKKWRDWDTWDLVDHLHEILPEWKDPNGSANPIGLPTLFKVLDLTSKEVRSVTDQANLSKS